MRITITNMIKHETFKANSKLCLLDRLCEICLGERIPADITDNRGVVLISANTKLSKTRLRIIELHRGQGIVIQNDPAAQMRINKLLTSGGNQSDL